MRGFNKFVLIAFFLLQSVTYGQVAVEVTKKKAITLPAKPEVVDNVVFIEAGTEPVIQEVALINVTSGSKFVRVTARKNLLEVADLKKLNDRQWLLSTSGTFLVEVFTFDPEKGLDEARVQVVLGNPDPTPPGPSPGPLPPSPVPPTPDVVAPIPSPGFRVLIVYESRLGVPEAAIDSGVRSYLNAKCVKEGGTAEFRIWDKDTNVAYAPKLWQDAMKRPRQTVPWIIISDGKTGYEGPLPTTVDSAIALLKKYGGE